MTETYDWSNGSGKLLSEKDVSGNVVSYTYQASGMLQQVLNASGEKTILDYTGTSLTRIRVERADGSQFSRVSYGYDSSNRLQVVTVDLTPDNAQDNIVYTTSYTYDGASKRVRTVTQSDGSAISINYDSSSRVTSITDALGNITGYLYSTGQTTVTDGRLVSVQQRDAVNADLGTSRYYYDNNHQLRMTEDATGVRTWLLYDAAGRRNGEVDGTGSLTEYVYDRNGQVTQTIRYATPVKAMFSPVMDAEIFTIPSLNPLTLSKVGLTNTAIGSATLVGAFTTATFGVENARKVSSLNVTNPDLFAMRFTGSINVFTAGDYTFYIRSDDGSNLYIDGVLQINNDRAQAVTTLANTVNLSVGRPTHRTIMAPLLSFRIWTAIW